MKTSAIICDLDGTLYDAKERTKAHILGEKKDFDAFHQKAVLDPPFQWCVQLLTAMRNHGFEIIFLSGRDEKYRGQANRWIQEHVKILPKDYTLFLRPDGHWVEDTILKREIYFRDIKPHFDVLFCVDDRARVVKMWREIGLPCLQCDEGLF